MSEEVHVKPDLVFPEVIEGETEPGQFEWIIRIKAVWDETSLGYEIQELTVKRHDRDPETSPHISSRRLRHLPVQTAFKEIVNRQVRLSDGSPYILPLLTKLTLEDGKIHWKPEEDARTMEMPLDRAQAAEVRLKEASRIYAVARAFQEPPMKYVSSLLGITAAGAAKVMERARAAGYSE